MTRRDVVAAERLRLTPEISELKFFIAHDAWVRRPPGLIFAGEIIDHETLELIGLVNNIMRNAERVRHAPCIGDRLRPAAFVLRA